MTKTRPDDINFLKFVLLLVFLGPFGGHCFYVGRKVRGFLMLGSMLLLLASITIFTPSSALTGEMHPWRAAFDGWWFPLDAPALITIIVWVCDWFGIIVFGNFRYPIRISGRDVAYNPEKS